MLACEACAFWWSNPRGFKSRLLHCFARLAHLNRLTHPVERDGGCSDDLSPCVEVVHQQACLLVRASHSPTGQVRARKFTMALKNRVPIALLPPF